jgi:hypothetical protein
MADGVAITAGSGTTIATDDISSVHYQRIKRSVGGDGSATDFLDKSSRSDTFTGTGSGTAVDVSAQGMKHFGMQVKGTGAAPTSWTVVLEVSLDGTNYTTLITHTNTEDSDGAVKWSPVAIVGLHFRSRVTALALGSASNIIVTIAAKP